MNLLLALLLFFGSLALLFVLLGIESKKRKNKLGHITGTVVLWHAPIVKWVGTVGTGFFGAFSICVLYYLGAKRPAVWLVVAFPLALAVLSLLSMLKGTLQLAAFGPSTLVYYYGLVGGPCQITFSCLTAVEEKISSQGTKKLLLQTAERKRPLVLESTLQNYNKLQKTLVAQKLLQKPVFKYK